MTEKSKIIERLTKSIIILTLIVLGMTLTIVIQTFNNDKIEEEELAVCGGTIDLDEKSLTDIAQYRRVANRINADFDAENGRKVFKTHCASCHTLSETTIIGPGLKGIFDRMPDRPSDWIFHFLKNSDSLAKSGDPYTRKLIHEFSAKDFEWNHRDTLFTEKEMIDLIGYIGMKQ